MKKIISCLLLVSLLLTLVPVSATNDILSDTWVGADDLGRTLPTNDDVGDVKQDKYVGIFYFLFMNSSDSDVLDTTETYLQQGVEGIWRLLSMDGMHVWARPYFGYYRITDEWILRKHAQLLTDAGVDFVFLDTTNYNGLYEKEYTKLLDVWSELRAQGINTPQVCFHNGGEAKTMRDHLVKQMEAYNNEKYADLWFKWEGKPLILGCSDGLNDEQKEYFTVRDSWAFNDSVGDGVGNWPWIAEYPQKIGKNLNGEKEQIVVSAGFHSNSSIGRSYSNLDQNVSGISDFGYGIDMSGEGVTFEEQWQRVFDVDPNVVMITGWNEFTFGRWENDGFGQNISSSYHVTKNDPVYKNLYVDAFSAEYSRDIEPISQLFGDNYYYQMVINIRKFKGVREVEKGTGSTEISFDNNFSEFSDIGPTYYDTVSDTTHRNYVDVTGSKVVNNSGRNDFTIVKVSKTKNYTYFYAECTDPITNPEEGDTAWMNLFIDADQTHETGWEGYDFVVNRTRDGEEVDIEKFYSSDWDSRYSVGKGTYKVNGNKILIKIESKLIGLSGRDNFDFKFADNSTTTGEVMEFMSLGDAAPNSRFNYRYEKQGGNIVKQGHSIAYWFIIGGSVAVVLGIIAVIFIFIKRKKECQVTD